ncbi:MAG TPA: hypothetical protein VFN43_08675 [Humibacillus sp.]|nr:hypothetical protein [Humibacillus sp.]
MPGLNASSATRPKLPGLLLGVAAAVALAGVLLTYTLLREYGDTNASGLLQGLKGATVPAVLVLALVAIAFSLRRTRVVAVVAVAVVLAAVVATAIAGQVAVGAKYDAYPRTPDCSASGPTTTGKDGSLDPTTTVALAKIQAAVDELQHPSRFIGTLETSSLEPNGASCLSGLATNDLSGAVSFYRAQLPRHGWTVREDSPTRLLATKGGLTIAIEQGDGETPQVRMTYLPG